MKIFTISYGEGLHHIREKFYSKETKCQMDIDISYSVFFLNTAVALKFNKN